MLRASIAARTPGGRYDVQEQLAAGGMGVIHRAHDRLAGREVAYKRLVVSSPGKRARMTLLFQREYETLARLAHPHIVETFDYGEDADGPYYTMELLSGQDLTRAAPQPYREACRILREVASALALVHARRFIHRDISPANIRLTNDGRAKLIDFGALTSFGKPEEIVGTPVCLAPECLSDAPLDQRVDLYSLGAVAYWLLTRTTSIRARNLQELPEAWSEPIAAPSLLMPDIPKELDALVLALLARDPLARPAHAAYVIEQLTTIAELPPEADEQRIAYSYLAHPPLSGRSDVLARLEKIASDTAAGRGSVALVEGRPGLGRSALLDAFALGAQVGGLAVLRARGERRAAGFELIRKLLDVAYALHPDLRPGVSQPKPPPTPGPETRAESAAEVAARHARIVETSRAVLLEFGRRSPAVLVIDDLHQADAESLSVLASLREDLESQALSLVGSLVLDSEGEDAPGLSALKAGAKRIPLTPLREEQMVEMVRSVFGDVQNTQRLGSWLHAQSGGNPANAMDLARLLLSRGSIRYTIGTFTLPHTLDDSVSSADLASAILARLGNVGREAQRVATALSLHEGALLPEQLAAALELPPRDVLLSLEELGARDVVNQHDGAFSLSANSLRAALKDALPVDDRKQLHVRLAQVFLAHGDGQTEAKLQASTHLLHGGRESDAVEIVARLGRAGLNGEAAARWVVLIEAVLAAFARQKRSKEESLALLIPLMHAAFYGQLAAQRRHVEDALAWMSHVCGMTLARRLRRVLGGKLSLMLGLLYAALRRALIPKTRRLGTLPEMLGEFVGLVSASTASAVISDENRTALRWNRSLEPLSALPPHTAGYLLREFCLATAEVGIGEFTTAAERYKRVIPALLKPVEGLEDSLRLTIYRGCLNGCGQASLTLAGDESLRLADELSGAGDPFFAPHAEGGRMGYYAYRGDREKAEYHRSRAEALALRGGNSWSAETLLARLQVMTAIMTRDAIALVQAKDTIGRLREVAPNMQRYAVFCEAWLESMRGHPERAVALYELHVDAPDSRFFYTWRFDRACYAAQLNAAGLHERARTVCEDLLGGTTDPERLKDMRHFALPQLALAKVGLGRRDEGRALMESYLAYALGTKNPLLIGDAHRDRAQIALADGDSAAFERHFEAMAAAYRETHNPCLIQQCDKLAAQAVASGMRAAAAPLIGLPAMFDPTTAYVPGDVSAVRGVHTTFMTPESQDKKAEG